MKKKSSLFGLLLVIAVLVLGVGYAVINQTELTISGNASAATETLDVEFTNVQTENESYFDMNETTIGDGLTAKIKAKDLTLNNAVTVTYTITNNETDVNATITPISITNTNSQYFKVETDLNSATTINAGETLDVVVTITLIKTPVDATDNTTTITIPFTATADNNNTNAGN